MQLRINQQAVNVLILPGSVPFTARELRAFERVDHLLRANPDFQARYPRAKLEQATFCPEHQDCFRLSYASRGGTVEIHAGRAAVVTIDLEKYRVTITT
jgi:hypothetical protein